MGNIREGIAGLGINFPALLWQIINFSLLIGLLYLVLYRPMLRVLQQRSEKIRESLEQADKMKVETVKAGEAVKAQIEEARRHGQSIVAQASQIGERVKEEARVEAHQETVTLIAKAREEITRESEEATQELKKEFADLAVRAAEKIVKQNLDREAHRRLIEETLREAETGKKG
ncbi:MAG: F0F1 ATP synthase subunit B [Chloroflexota bacterium]